MITRILLLPLFLIVLSSYAAMPPIYRVNPITTNTPAGMTNVIKAVAGTSGGGASVAATSPIVASTNGTTGLVTLSAPTALTTGSSLNAAHLSGAVPTTVTGGIWLTNGATNVTLAGAFTGNGAGLSNTYQASLVILGDSMSGFDHSQKGWVSKLMTNSTLGDSIGIVDLAVSSDTVANDVALWASRYGSLALALNRSNSWALVWKGYNDGASAAATIEGNLATIYSNLRGYGYKVCAVTIIYTNGAPNATTFAAVNTWIKATAVVDLVIDAQGMTPTFDDGIHPDEAFGVRLALTVGTNLPIARLPILGGTFVGGIRVKAEGPASGYPWSGYSRFDGPIDIGNGARFGWRDDAHRYTATYLQGAVGPGSIDGTGYGLGIYTYETLRMWFPEYPIGEPIRLTYNTRIEGSLDVTNGIVAGTLTATNGIVLYPSTFITNSAANKAAIPATVSGAASTNYLYYNFTGIGPICAYCITNTAATNSWTYGYLRPTSTDTTWP
jgi:hypothetical protein